MFTSQAARNLDRSLDELSDDESEASESKADADMRLSSSTRRSQWRCGGGERRDPLDASTRYMLAVSTAIARGVAAEAGGFGKPDTVIASAAETAISLTPAHRAWAFVQFAQRGGNPVDFAGSPARTMAQLGVKASAGLLDSESALEATLGVANEIRSSESEATKPSPLHPSAGCTVPLPPLASSGGPAGLVVAALADTCRVIAAADGADTNQIELGRTALLDDAACRSAAGAAIRVLRDLNCEPGTLPGLLPLTKAGLSVRNTARHGQRSTMDKR